MQYRGKPGPTNVLSFPQCTHKESSPRSDLLGDVVICSDRVVTDAPELGYTNEEMLFYLLIHGVLHLIGLDHIQAEDAATMEEAVERIFNSFYPENT